MKIIDNFLPVSVADDIETTMTGEGFPWYYVSDVTREHRVEGAYSQPGFHHTPFMNYRPQSPFHDYFKMLAMSIKDAIDHDGDLHLFRIRAGLNIANSNSNEDWRQEYNYPHVDQNSDFVTCKSYTCLYYVNESDGDTFIFDQTEASKNYTTRHRVTPHKNRVMIFDGEQYHASSSPVVNDVRIAITFNFHAEKVI